MNHKKLFRSLVRAYRLQQCTRRVGSRDWASRLARFGSPGFSAQARPGGRLALGELGLEIEPAQEFALGAYGYLWDIKACAFALQPVAGGELEVTGHGVRARLNSIEEAFIFREIFCERTYDVQPVPAARVIDIGMNVGLASIFFASALPDCHIDAFEPFAATFARAQYQFSLNPALTGRIRAHNFGLWQANERRQVAIDASHKGSTGIWGVQAGIEAPDKVIQEIALRDAAEVLEPLLRQPDGPVILKLDAEGSEYGIFARLADAGLADRFDVILMEWHRNQPDQNPAELRHRLSHLGYRSLCQHYLHRPFGMIYAFRPADRT